jgi:hypothetical protein
MNKRSCLSLLAMTVLFFATSTQDLRASDSVAADQAGRGTSQPFHAVSRAELHQSIQDSQKQAFESRKWIQDFLARPDIKTAIQHAGGSLENAKAQVALLSDAELLQLNRQMMRLNLQTATAAGTGRTIIGLILLALSIYLLYQRFS